jgi:hypothetical protein
MSPNITHPKRNSILAPRSNIINGRIGVSESVLSGLDTRVVNVAVWMMRIVVEVIAVSVSGAVVGVVDAVGTAVCHAGG